jgi:hypothetical protein
LLFSAVSSALREYIFMTDEIRKYIDNVRQHRGWRWALLAALLLGGGIGVLILLLRGAP